MEKGFDKTTIKDIEAATGLKAGSIYNLFENKTDILKGCSAFVYDVLIGESREKAEKDMGSLRSVAYSIMLELYAASGNPVLAALLDNGKMNGSSKKLADLRLELTCAYLKKHGVGMDSGDINVRLEGLSGAMNRYVSNYIETSRGSCRAEGIAMITMFKALFAVPGKTESAETIADETLECLKKECGDLEKRIVRYG